MTTCWPGGVIVEFDYAGWTARYPEFAGVQEATAQMYFNEAGLYCGNSAEASGPPISDPAIKTMLMNMVTAHIAYLNGYTTLPDGTVVPKSELVGRITNASEGSVSVATENQYPPGTVQWYQQTKYGSAFWAATASFRTMRYRRANPAVLLGQARGGLWGFRGFRGRGL